MVTNTGNVPLTDLALTDDTFVTELADLIANEELPDELAPGASFERILTGITAEEGQHSNTATATGKYNDTVVDDTDPAHYRGIDVPEDCEKVGSAWAHVDQGFSFGTGNATYVEYSKSAGSMEIPVEYQLGEGANYIKVGTLHVWNDADKIYVRFEAHSPYKWGKADLYVGLEEPEVSSPGRLGWTYDPNDNDVDSLFDDYTFEKDMIFSTGPPSTGPTHTPDTDFSGVDEGAKLYIAAHTDVWECQPIND